MGSSRVNQLAIKKSMILIASKLRTNILSDPYITNFNHKLMFCGGMISYPILTYGMAEDRGGSLGSYAFIGIITVPGAIIAGIVTPVIFYTSPIWTTLWIGSKIFKTSQKIN